MLLLKVIKCSRIFNPLTPQANLPNFLSHGASLCARFARARSSAINPILYSIKIREFRVAFIEILCKTANLAKAEEIEMRFFKSPNVVARLQAEHAQGAEELNWSNQETEQPIGN